MEFFDNKKNWAVEHIKVGRAWKKDELRIKSNQDLHKLWYANVVHFVNMNFYFFSIFNQEMYFHQLYCYIYIY